MARRSIDGRAPGRDLRANRQAKRLGFGATCAARACAAARSGPPRSNSGRLTCTLKTLPTSPVPAFDDFVPATISGSGTAAGRPHARHERRGLASRAAARARSPRTLLGACDQLVDRRQGARRRRVRPDRFDRVGSRRRRQRNRSAGLAPVPARPPPRRGRRRRRSPLARREAGRSRPPRLRLRAGRARPPDRAAGRGCAPAPAPAPVPPRDP